MNVFMEHCDESSWSILMTGVMLVNMVTQGEGSSKEDKVKPLGKLIFKREGKEWVFS